jgi:phage tail-like protein
MTHPADRVYRFTTLSHWAEGLAKGLILAPDGSITTPGPQVGRLVVPAAPGSDVVLMSGDPCGRLLWLDAEGAVRVLDGDLPIRIACIGTDLARGASHLVWGQEISWIVADGDLVRLDASSGDRMGNFARPGWRATHAVEDRCDGVIVLEARGDAVGLRQIRPDGTDRPIDTGPLPAGVVAMSRFSVDDPVVIVGAGGDGWQSLSVAITAQGGGAAPELRAFAGRADAIPGPLVTMTGPERQLFVAPGKDGYFAISRGLVEPVVNYEPVPGMGALIAVQWAGGRLYLATRNGIYVSESAGQNGPSLTGSYITPPLHSPPGVRSGWQRADLRLRLPRSARITIRSRAVANPNSFRDLLRGNPEDSELEAGWDDATASVHFGEDADTVLRHYLGDRTAEWLALRIDISTSVDSPPVEIAGLDILYPNRSLIEDLPAIYRTRDGSEAGLRQMLAPFQALADEIDDLIGGRLKNLDPDEADALWSGFLLGWLGHAKFARLPLQARRRLLKAMPAILPRRGTLAGLALVIDALAPEGFAIEDAGLGPDLWVLVDRMDPAAPRLGTDTRVVRGSAAGLRLGCGEGLGAIHLGTICVDPLAAARRCSGDVTIRIFGNGAEARIRPFVDRIIRDFVPAHTHVRFLYGPHAPAELLEHPRPSTGGDPGAHLITLDPGLDRRIGAWRLPDGSARIVHDEPANLNSAVLDGTLVLG